MKQLVIFSQDFFLNNLWWMIIAGICVLTGLYFLITDLIIPSIRKKKKVTPKKEINVTSYLFALGGDSNILTHSRTGSRIVLTLNDYSLIQKDVLLELGVTGFIEKSDKLTLVIKDDAERVYKVLFPND